MKEIVKINLDNEMDLILTHKRSMKIAELCGLSTAAQTIFATAVSEIARCSISQGKDSHLILGIDFLKGGKKDITAIIYDRVDLSVASSQPFDYVRRLLGDLQYELINGIYNITLSYKIAQPGLISENKVQTFRDYFKLEPPLSPYDEIRKKNIQLIDLSEKLGESENKYRQFTDTLPQMAFSISVENEITLSNKWLKDYLGTSFLNVNKASWQQILHPDDFNNVSNNWEAARKSRTKFSGQARIAHKGNYVWHLLSIVPQKSENNSLVGWIGSFVDIHAQKVIEETLKDNKELRIAQEKLKKSNDELSKKNRELEQFAYVASHDLQEPLRKIRNFTSLAQRGMTTEEKEKLFFDKINSSAERMSNLIRDVLNFSRLTTTVNEIIPINLGDLIKDILVDFEYSIQNKKAKFTIGNLPQIMGIPVQINQLFYNLVSNSLKFNNGEPSVVISSTTIAGTELKGIEVPDHTISYHVISFADNGIGIDKRYADKIFTIFQRLHGQGEFEGTGIGLALCKKIIDNHNGAIAFESELGKGTTFYVYLPLQK